MRVLFSLLLILSLMNGSAVFCSTSKYSDTLYKIEEELYGLNYSDQTDEMRIARLEQSVYGTVSKRGMAERMKKLSEDLSVDVFDEKITPTEDSFSSEEIAEDSSVRYPALDRVETKLFSKTYSGANLKSRIVRIEQHLFNQVYDKEDYHTRVERIKNNVFQEDYRMASEGARYDNDYYGYNAGSLNSDDLGGLDRNLYSGRGYTSFADRLSSLENQMFGTPYDLDTDEERLNRLNGAYKAQKSIKKYDSNKFQQGMSTAMQVGAMILMLLCMVL